MAFLMVGANVGNAYAPTAGYTQLEQSKTNHRRCTVVVLAMARTFSEQSVQKAQIIKQCKT